MQVTTFRLKYVCFGNQWFEEVQDRWLYRDFLRNQLWRENWISFDCAYYEASQDRIYLGIASFEADIFRAFDRRTGSFVDLGYSRVADPYDAKFHRSLAKGPDGRLYAAVALLHDVDELQQAPGSPIIRYDTCTGSIERLPPPLPHAYIQSIDIDCRRNRLYCQCFPPEKLLAVDLGTGAVEELGLIGSGIAGMTQGQNILVDDDGCVWSNWSLIRAWQDAPGPDAWRISKFDPASNRMVFFQKGLPRPDGSYGTVSAESYFNFHDGFIYASGAEGCLYRIDPQTGDAEYLFNPTPDRPSRLTSLAADGDGAAYGVTGRNGHCELMRVDYKAGRFEKLGVLADSDGTRLWQCHDVVAAGASTLYLCENDNPYRSAYLWEVRL